MAATHHYELNVRWTGEAGTGTSDYRGYRRDNEILGAGKPVILGSSDPAFRGDAARWNPEELLVASLSQCHMLWYLHLCAVGGVVVTDYADTPTGTMTMDATGGGGEFTEVVLRPAVTVADSSMTAKAQALHGEIGALCYIARSVSFPVRHEPTVEPALPHGHHIVGQVGPHESDVENRDPRRADGHVLAVDPRAARRKRVWRRRRLLARHVSLSSTSSGRGS
jgi:organic hydroperoxide reductase OsmC/OhrA